MLSFITGITMALTMTVTIVPHPNKATPDDVAKYEQIIGAKLPASYRAFLLEKNGGRPDFSVDRNIWFPIQWSGQKFASGYEGALLESLDSLDSGDPQSLFRTYENTHVRMKLIPADTITIGDASGGALLLGVGPVNRGKVFFWAQDHMPVQDDVEPGYDNVGLVAPDFDSFLKLLRPLSEVKADQARK